MRHLKSVFKTSLLGVALLGSGIVLGGSIASSADVWNKSTTVADNSKIPALSATKDKAAATANTAAKGTTNAATAAKNIPVTLGENIRIVVVEWKIKKGREQDFLDYWATRATIADRSGLISEFLSKPDSKEKWPWINWTGPIDRPDVTTFYNVGIWRDGENFQDQIGKYIDNNRPPLEFEGDKRTRVFLAPQRWRTGESALPKSDSAGTK